MDPVSIALSLLMKNPNLGAAAVGAAQRATAPGIVDVAKMQESVADLARGVLTCYHRSARFRSVDVARGSWSRQAQYGAENSALMRINYQGVTGAKYQMIVAVMAKQDQVRSSVIADNATVPYNKRCQLEEWTRA